MKANKLLAIISCCLLLLPILCLTIIPISAFASQEEPHVTGVYINGNLLTPDVDYDSKGFIIYDSYRDTLPDGKNTIEIRLSDGTSIEEQFNIDRSGPDGLSIQYESEPPDHIASEGPNQAAELSEAKPVIDNEGNPSKPVNQDQIALYILGGFVALAILLPIISMAVSRKKKSQPSPQVAAKSSAAATQKNTPQRTASQGAASQNKASNSINRTNKTTRPRR